MVSGLKKPLCFAIALDAFHPVWPLLSIEDQAAQVVVHEDVQRPSAFIAQGSGQSSSRPGVRRPLLLNRLAPGISQL